MGFLFDGLASAGSLRLAQRAAGGIYPFEDAVHMKKTLALALGALLLAGCTPVVNTRGYLRDPDVEKAIVVNKDTKTSIQSSLGYPSTEATFTEAGDAWYYISSVEKQVAFFTPRVETRSILAVYFDKDGKVTDLKHYSLHDGHVVIFETRETPTKGRELTFLQQLFNATPGVPLGNGGSSGTNNPNPGGGNGGPGGGGAPPP
jgi:outer membrane protein assembly factor BamE (lipoprotein component of BamABCDE complex)